MTGSRYAESVRVGPKQKKKSPGKKKDSSAIRFGSPDGNLVAFGCNQGCQDGLFVPLKMGPESYFFRSDHWQKVPTGPHWREADLFAVLQSDRVHFVHAQRVAAEPRRSDGDLAGAVKPMPGGHDRFNDNQRLHILLWTWRRTGAHSPAGEARALARLSPDGKEHFVCFNRDRNQDDFSYYVFRACASGTCNIRRLTADRIQRRRTALMVALMGTHGCRARAAD